MPAKSKKMRRLMAIAEHNPEEVYPENEGVLKMSKSQLRDYAKTKEKGLPEKVKKPKESVNTFIKRRNRRQYGK